MKKLLLGILAGLLVGGSLVTAQILGIHRETVVWDFVNGIKIGGISLSQDGTATFTNLSTISDAAGEGTFTLGRPTAGTVTVTAKDDNSNAALTIAPGGTGALTIGGASSGVLRLNAGTNGTVLLGRSDAGVVTVTAADDDATAALTMLPGGAAAMTIGGTSTTKLDVITDGGTVTIDGSITTPAAGIITGATSLVMTFGTTGIFTLDANGLRMTPPAAETVTAGSTITANACGATKRITSAGAVTTNTTDTFTAPGAANTDCRMVICNTGANNITLDNNAHFKSIAGADIVLTADDCTQVSSDGTVWRSTGGLVAN